MTNAEPTTGWVMLENHKNVADGYFSSSVKSSGVENADNPEANTYCIIGAVDSSEYLIDGKYWLKLMYRYSDGTDAILEWTQTSWLTEQYIVGADLSNVDDKYSGHGCLAFEGLALSNAATAYLDGNGKTNCGWNAVGTTAQFPGLSAGIPAQPTKLAYSSTLWIRSPSSTTTTTVLAASGVCMHSTKFTKGYSFTAPYAGKVIGVELSNPIGGTTCNEDEYDQKYWGGCVSDRMRFSLIREDAEEGNEVMYPTQTTEGLSLYDDWDCPVGGCSVNTWTISGFSYDSEFLSLKDTEHPHEVSVDDVFSLQISEGCCDYTTSDNEGTTCADVHFVYESIDGEYHGDSDLVLSRPVVSHGNLNNKNTPCSGDDCLGECEGECDRDDHCQHGLVCWHRTGWDSNVPPGCSGSAHDEHHDYCYDPNRRIPVEDKGVNQPSDDCGCLLECEGDCDSDADCHGNLVCWHRDGWDDLVPPGCRGDVHGRLYDYCYDPNNHDSNAREISVSSGNAAATHSVHSEDAGESVDDFVAIALGAAVGMAMVGVVVAVIVVMRRRKGMEKEEEVAMSEVVTAPKVQPTESMDGVEAISESVTVPKEQPAESIDGVETV